MWYFISPVLFLRCMLWRVHRELYKVKSQFKAPNNTAVCGKSNIRLRSFGKLHQGLCQCSLKKFQGPKSALSNFHVQEGQGELNLMVESCMGWHGEGNCTSKRMDFGHAMAVLGRELKRKDSDGFLSNSAYSMILWLCHSLIL